jgi:FAD/FMN-containing dehydrogenase
MLAATPSNAPSPPALYSAGDLCRAVRAASAEAWRAGSRGLDRVLHHDADRALLEVQACVPWHALSRFSGTDGLCGTVGESVAENRLGPDGRPMVAHVHALTLATTDGQLRRASREHSPELFRLAVGGFGAFGPFYSVTLDLGSWRRAAASICAPACFELPPTAAAGTPHVVELLLPPERSDALAARARDLVAERRCALVRLEARPVQPEDVTLLRWARREWVLLRVEYCSRPTLGASVAAAQLCARMLDLAVEAGGSFLPSLLPIASRAQAEACYPMLAQFIAEKRRLDPAERFASPWYRSVCRAWRAAPCRVRFARP